MYDVVANVKVNCLNSRRTIKLIVRISGHPVDTNTIYRVTSMVRFTWSLSLGYPVLVYLMKVGNTTPFRPHQFLLDKALISPTYKRKCKIWNLFMVFFSMKYTSPWWLCYYNKNTITGTLSCVYSDRLGIFGFDSIMRRPIQ